MRRRASLLAFALLAACEPVRPDLQHIIAFEEPAACRFAPQTSRLFASLAGYDERSDTHRPASTVEIPGIGSLRPRTSTDRRGILHQELPLSGRWHGLQVVKLSQRFLPNSDFSDLSIEFAEPAEQARERLNLLGFQLPTPGRTREFGDGLSEYIWIEKSRGGSALHCST